MSPSKAVRLVLEAACKRAAKDGLVEDYTEIEAAAILGDDITDEMLLKAGICVDTDSLNPEVTAQNMGTSLSNGAGPLEREDATRNILKQHVEETLKRVEERRLAGVVGEVADSTDDTEVPKAVPEVPPWEGERLARKDAAISALNTYDELRALLDVLKEDNPKGREVLIVAARLALAVAPSGLVGTPAFARLVGDLNTSCLSYVEANPETKLPE